MLLHQRTHWCAGDVTNSLSVARAAALEYWVRFRKALQNKFDRPAHDVATAIYAYILYGIGF